MAEIIVINLPLIFKEKDFTGMVSIDEMRGLLDDLLNEIPYPIWVNLNGGIVLLPDVKLSLHSTEERPIYTMGEYHYSHGMGRSVRLYYGSIMAVYGHLSMDEMVKQLDKILKHELTHHLESMAGERELEREDLRVLSAFLSYPIGIDSGKTEAPISDKTEK